VLIGERLSLACYIKDALPAALHLSWKYADDFSSGIIANARCGGDNCHSASVGGALLGFANGVPERWLNGGSPCTWEKEARAARLLQINFGPVQNRRAGARDRC